jgi:protein gp37
MEREWVISIRKQCRESRVPFFFKQWGGVRKSRAGRILDGRTYDEMPQSPGQVLGRTVAGVGAQKSLTMVG